MDASTSALNSIQEVFSAYHLTLARRSKLSIFLRELSTTNRRGLLTFGRVAAVCEDLVFPSLGEVLSAADALAELKELLAQARVATTAADANPSGSSSLSGTNNSRGGGGSETTTSSRLLEDLGDSVFVSSFVSALFVSGRDADAQLGLKARRLGAELQAMMGSGALAIKDTMNSIVSNHLLRLGKHRYLQSVDLAHTLMSEGQQQMLGTLLASRPQLRYVDLSYCLLKDAFVKALVVPAFSNPQSHIVVLMLAGNALTDASGTLLATLAAGGADQEELAPVASALGGTPRYPPTLAPRLQVLDVGGTRSIGGESMKEEEGNEISAAVLEDIRHGLRVRERYFAPVAPHHHMPPHYKNITPQQTVEMEENNDSSSTCSGHFHHVMAFDGGVMTNLSQVYWLQQCLEANAVVKAVVSAAAQQRQEKKQGGAEAAGDGGSPILSCPTVTPSEKKARLLESWKALPDISRVNTFVGSGFGAIVAAAMALSVPLDEVQQFFITLADQVFLQGHYSYYALVAGRMIREWWTGGNYYSASTLKQGLERLFGSRTVMECRRPDPGSDTRSAYTGGQFSSSFPHGAGLPPVNLVLVAGTHTAAPDTLPAETSVFTSYQHPHLKIVEVLMACCSFEGFFAPYQLSDHSVGSLPPFSGSGNTNLGRTESSYVDAEEVSPNPTLPALLELANYVPLKYFVVDSVSTTVEEAAERGGSADGLGGGTSVLPRTPLLRTPQLLIKAITTHGLRLSPEERSKREATAAKSGGNGRTDGGGNTVTMPSTPSILRERRLDSACQATHTTVARCFQAIHSSSSSSVREPPPPLLPLPSSPLSSQYHRRVLSTAMVCGAVGAATVDDSGGSSSGCRISLDEDNTFLLNEVLWNDIALWIRRPPAP